MVVTQLAELRMSALGHGHRAHEQLRQARLQVLYNRNHVGLSLSSLGIAKQSLACHYHINRNQFAILSFGWILGEVSAERVV